jgi:hypothetical protein
MSKASQRKLSKNPNLKKPMPQNLAITQEHSHQNPINSATIKTQKPVNNKPILPQRAARKR